MSHTAPAPSPAPVRPRTGLAVTALVLGILAAVGCAIPVLNIGSIVLGVVALALGIVSLVKRRPGKGMAIAGVVLSVVAIVGAIIANVVAAAVVTSVDQAVTDAGNGYSEVAPEDAAAVAETALAIGTVAPVADYSVTVTGVVQNANDVIAAANEFNEAPVGQFVLVELTTTYNGDTEGNPWIDLSPSFMGTDARDYSTTSCSAVLPNDGFTQPTLRTGGTTNYQVCFDLPAEAISGGHVSVEGLLDFTGEPAVWNAA